ncbi:EAL domain-containing protein [Pseudomonas svalbardensis]|uniref:EAL domain-containing protein n=1 Tax=Pseudomonas svalbardensis TaxID=3042029 RepID=UPI00350E4319
MQFLPASGELATGIVAEHGERFFAADSYAGRTILRQLHTMGIHIAIDDFGGGHTSLAQLKDLPISEPQDRQILCTGHAKRSSK